MKHINSLMTMLFFFAVSMRSLSMEQLSSFSFSNNFLKTNPAHIFPIIVAAYPLLSKVASDYFLNRTKISDNPELNERFCQEQKQLQGFVQEELNLSGIVDPEKITLNFSRWDDLAASDHSIFMGPGFRKKFIKAGILNAPLKTSYTYYGDKKIVEHTWHTVDPKETPTRLLEIRCRLQHEIGHLKANDSLRKLLVSSATSTVSYLLTIALLHKYNGSISSKVLQSIIIAASAFPLYAVNRLCVNAYLRYREACADEQIPNNVEYLDAGVRCLTKALKKEKQDIADGKCPDIYNNRFAYLWYAEHPTSEWRVDRFQKRLENLKTQKES